MTKQELNKRMEALILKAKLLDGLVLSGNLPVRATDPAVIKLKAEFDILEAERRATSYNTPSIKHLLL